MKINTSVFLLKNEYQSEDDVFQNIENVIDGNGWRIYVNSKTCDLPSWTNVIGMYLPSGDHPPIFRSSSSGAIISLKVRNRIMAFCFASGRYNIDLNKVEDRFGLKTCLNLQSSDKFRNVKIQSLEVNGVQKLESRSAWSELDEYSINMDNEIIKSVTGQIDDERFGKNVSGVDSLTIKIDFENFNIREICELLLDAYNSEEYKRKYDYIDKIFPVNKKDLLLKLDTELLKLIKRHDENVWMCIPDFVNWEDIEYFKYLDSNEEDDVNVEKFYDYIDDKDIDFLKKTMVKAVSSENRIIYKKSAYYCTTADVNVDGVSYILNNGRWYSVSSSFEQELNELSEEIRLRSETYEIAGLPICKYDKEEMYNIECANSPKYDLWDRQLVNKTEVCDLWSENKEFIHVKFYSSSSVLSHLFYQGLVSATQMSQSRSFREKVEQKGNEKNLFTTGRMFNSVDTFSPGGYSVKFAIISKDISRFRLPPFSLISYRQAKKNIEDMGYSVGIIRIQKDLSQEIDSTH